MYFEGSEKKFELIARGANFRARPASFWRETVELAGARILSKISNEACDAYLLSESSLFVWDDRVTMITCGRTTLARAAAHVLDHLNAKLDFITYERKIEYYPHQQATDFQQDVNLLQERCPGLSYRFGAPDEHHLFLFHLDQPFQPQSSDCTLEVLMYNLQGTAAEIFRADQTIERVRQLTALDQIFPGFTIDDYLFDPCGYSLNAIRGSEYYTIHVTPEDTGSYVSFETNVRLGTNMESLLRQVIEVFQPRSFDVVYFHPRKELASFAIAPFIQLNDFRQSLNCGFEVGFATYSQKMGEPKAAVRLEPFVREH